MDAKTIMGIVLFLTVGAVLIYFKFRNARKK